VGLYILSDAMLKQMELDGRIDVDAFVTRVQRHSSFSLVNSLHGYIAVHDLLSRAVGARDRFYKAPFRPKTFRTNCRPQNFGQVSAQKQDTLRPVLKNNAMGQSYKFELSWVVFVVIETFYILISKTS
jgi:hypothetical protein